MNLRLFAWHFNFYPIFYICWQIMHNDIEILWRVVLNQSQSRIIKVIPKLDRCALWSPEVYKGGIWLDPVAYLNGVLQGFILCDLQPKMMVVQQPCHI